ncbi:nitroreductase/quinone reductase family protein [Williamsia sp.]|uniref:nitroreductase/quinone reductase family protein n=1 Tax=Williamsia sp. TaxID=1872085 RepID=UPI001A30DC10|nr:nitroreductase/quinone reductase family protein [Williamsia sp.]MBJ7290512.1 nitroreductase family deazaflavin-dependent oxidoreductase [Williamsia sp.]
MTQLRGSWAALTGALALSWGPYVIDPTGGLWAPLAQTVVFVGLVVAAVVCPRAKLRLVRTVQRRALNPLVRALYGVGVNPLGLVVLETRGRRTGCPRRTPVGNGRTGNDLWVIAEHGVQAQYVRNVLADPRVRVRIRCGLRYRWVAGIATVLPDDDVLARQRAVVAWHPLRLFNAMNVRLLGVEPVSVHIALLPGVDDSDRTNDQHVRRAIDNTAVRAGL